MSVKPVIRELHLGGGTPTFFSAANLSFLVNAILEKCEIHPDRSFSIEGHPNNTTKEQLDTLFKLGFRRVSFGIQDHDPDVQRIINRIQPLENVRRVTDTARRIGYTSVNYDLIYGLPLQTVRSIEKTVADTIELKPDRIAFYSYAHVPWTSRGQRLFDETDLPSAELKMKLYQAANKMFLENGYADIGMDHFALSTDELWSAYNNGTLHRNFMGYTTQKTSTIIGLGVSSISDTGNAFAQNEKTLSKYTEAVNKNELPVTKGYFLDEEDELLRNYILDVSCKGKVVFKEEHMPVINEYVLPPLAELEKDGLVVSKMNGFEITSAGKSFIRNICSVFDLKLKRQVIPSQQPLFSRAI